MANLLEILENTPVDEARSFLQVIAPYFDVTLTPAGDILRSSFNALPESAQQTFLNTLEIAMTHGRLTGIAAARNYFADKYALDPTNINQIGQFLQGAIAAKNSNLLTAALDYFAKTNGYADSLLSAFGLPTSAAAKTIIALAVGYAIKNNKEIRESETALALWNGLKGAIDSGKQWLIDQGVIQGPSATRIELEKERVRLLAEKKDIVDKQAKLIDELETISDQLQELIKNPKNTTPQQINTLKDKRENFQLEIKRNNDLVQNLNNKIEQVDQDLLIQQSGTVTVTPPPKTPEEIAAEEKQFYEDLKANLANVPTDEHLAVLELLKTDLANSGRNNLIPFVDKAFTEVIQDLKVDQTAQVVQETRQDEAKLVGEEAPNPTVEVEGGNEMEEQLQAHLQPNQPFRFLDKNPALFYSLERARAKEEKKKKKALKKIKKAAKRKEASAPKPGTIATGGKGEDWQKHVRDYMKKHNIKNLFDALGPASKTYKK